MYNRWLVFLFFLTNVNCFAQVAPTTTSNPVPSVSQLKWHQLEYYWFAHFGPNTFTGEEWGSGKEPTSIFNPVQFDARQWCRLAKQAGAKGIVITAKHHDGFCLWPSNYSTHTVRESPWKNGKGDLLKELSLACKEYGIQFGVYLSPWDRNHPAYGTEAYNQVFVNMLREIFEQYGPIWELWWDGANGEGPNGKKQIYDWELFRNTVKTLSPQTVIFSDVGPHIRWVGNEKGMAGLTNWNLLNTNGFTAGMGAPKNDTLQRGNKYGTNWIPAECDVSIRPGWFWRATEDSKVKSATQLFQLYLKSVGRGANLLLNVPPTNQGLIAVADSNSLQNFHSLVKESFKNNLATKAMLSIVENNKATKAPLLKDNNFLTALSISNSCQHVHVDLKIEKAINCIVLQENISQGQACSQFDLSLYDEKNQLIKSITGTTIGYKRIISFPTLSVKKIILRILEQKNTVALGELQLYKIDDTLIEN